MKNIITLFFLLLGINSLLAGEIKDVTLTEIGIGKTKDDAKNNALRNAVEKAFGTFISSNTALMNDDLVKDEIVSVSNGNIKKFKILSETAMPDGSYSNVTEVTVSIEKMAKFCTNKGMTVEFNGESFAANIKLQQLNKINEEKVVQNLIQVISNVVYKGFDYTISANEPVSSQNNWKVSLAVTAKANTNIANIQKIMVNTISGISLKENEVEAYKKQETKFYSVKIDDIEYYLRNESSVTNLIVLFAKTIPEFSKRFIIQNGINNLDGIQIINCINKNYRGHSKQTDYTLCNYWWGKSIGVNYEISVFLKKMEVSQILMGEKPSSFWSDAYLEKSPAWAYKTQYQPRTNSFLFSTILNLSALTKMEFTYNFDQILNAEDLSKIKKYEIKPIN
jgi:hypothetical protein